MSRSAAQTIKIAVAERLARASIGELVSHDALRLVAGHENADRYYLIVNDACALLRKEGGVVFATVTGEGYRRLSSGEGVNYEGEIGVRRTHRAAIRSHRRLGQALFHANDAKPEEVRLANQRLSCFGLNAYLTKAQTIRHLPETRPMQPDPLRGLRDALGI